MFPMLKTLSYEKIYGGDYSDEMLIQCHSNVFFDSIDLSMRDIYDTKFEPNNFDTILSSRFLFHCDDQPRLFREFTRIIKPNGYLVFDTLNWSPRSRFAFYSKQLGGDIFTNDHESIVTLANQHGFTVIDLQNIFVLPSFLYNFIPGFLMKLVRRLELIWPDVLKTKTVWLLKKND